MFSKSSWISRLSCLPGRTYMAPDKPDCGIGKFLRINSPNRPCENIPPPLYDIFVVTALRRCVTPFYTLYVLLFHWNSSEKRQRNKKINTCLELTSSRRCRRGDCNEEILLVPSVWFSVREK